MDQLQELLTGKKPPAVYRLMSRAAAATIRETVEAKGWRCFVLDGDVITDKSSFLQTAAAAMHFPNYFGKNWDAFEESINDLSWAAAPGYLLLYDNLENFANRAPNEWATANQILRDAIVQWQQRAIPFAILVRKTGNFVRGVPKLCNK